MIVKHRVADKRGKRIQMRILDKRKVIYRYLPGTSANKKPGMSSPLFEASLLTSSRPVNATVVERHC